MVSKRKHKYEPPFAWIAPHSWAIATGAIFLLGIILRFIDLDVLPPALYGGEAAVGLQALELTRHGQPVLLNLTNSYAPLWVWLQSLSVVIFGHTAIALRIWPAVLGSLAVVTTFYWARSWFKTRVGILAAFFMAVTPWSITLSRNALVPALIPLLVTLTLWLAGRAYTGLGRWRHLWLGLVLAADLLSGPLGWMLAVSVVVVGAVLQLKAKRRTLFTPGLLMSVGGFSAGLALLAYLAASSWDSVRHLPSALGLTSSLSDLGANLLKTLVMFNQFGDDNYRHNLSGEPLLNPFIGLMLIAGILVGISRLHHRRYRVLFIMTGLLLIPVFISNVGVPNAAHASAIMPLIFVFAAFGTSYMLEQWYKTFPINSAARSTGQSAIIVLLGLSFFQGYTQYFRVWGGSSEVYNAYHEGATRIASFIAAGKTNSNEVVIAPVAEQPTVAFLNYGGRKFTSLTSSQIARLPVTPGHYEFVMVAASRDAAIKNLKLKFPGGVLRPHYSDYNQTEIFYSYEVTK